METTTLANVDGLISAPSDKIEEGGVEIVEEESIDIVPSTVTLDDEREVQYGLERVFSVVDHGENQGSDDPSHDLVNHNDDPGSDSTFRVPAAAVLTEQEPEEVMNATQSEPWWKRNRSWLILCAATVLVVLILAIVLVLTLDTSND